VTYSINWDNIKNLSFYESLDFVGISGYYSLSYKKDPSVEELTKKWEKVKTKILTIQEKDFKKPIIFTEVGYTSQDGTNKDPWNYYISETVDLQEQKDCYQAFTNVWLDEELLRGVFFYDYFGVGGKDDLGYTFRNKQNISNDFQMMLCMYLQKLNRFLLL